MKAIYSLIHLVFLFNLISSIASGQVTFQKSLGSQTHRTKGSYSQQTSDGGYMIAGTSNIGWGGAISDFFLVKLNSSGDTSWTKSYGGSFDDICYSAQQTFDGGYVLAGYTRSFGAGSFDGYVIKTDSNGNTLWSKTFGGVGDDIFESVIQTKDSGYILCGNSSYLIYAVKINKLGVLQWSKSYGGGWAHSVFQNSDTGFILTGNTSGSPQKIFLIRTDANGNLIWGNNYGNLGESGYCVKETEDDGFIVTGYTNSAVPVFPEAFLLKTDSSGNTQWMKTYGGSNEDAGSYVEQTADLGYIMAGRSRSFNVYSGGMLVYLVKTDQNGDILWTRSYGDYYNYNMGNCVKMTNDGGYVITGNYIPVYMDNIYLIKTDSSGNSGCFDNMTGTVINNFSPLVNPFGNSNTLSPTELNAATILSDSLVESISLCSSTFINEIENPISNPYPQPSHTNVNFYFAEKIKSLMIYNALGEKVDELKLNTTGDYKFDVTQFTLGIYFFKFEGENFYVVKKVIVE